ncbi:MAG: RNA polymerase sigma-70 factor [Bacteroidales bacterium]|nr:RNA polymerase sigma-70 factor [Bacteroidales bacterium]
MDKDRILIEKFKTGDMVAFEQLFRKYYNELCGYAYQYFSDRDTVEDIVQDLFYKLWQKRERLEIRTSFRAYLYRAVYNNTLQVLKEKNSLQPIESEHGTYEVILSEEIFDTVESKEIHLIIEKTLEKMPERVRKIFELSRFEGLRYREIAEHLSISIKTVEANMGKALKIFRKSLREYVVER